MKLPALPPRRPTRVPARVLPIPLHLLFPRLTRWAAATTLAAAVGVAGLLVGCAAAPPPPDWQMNATSSVERATAAYLEGNTRVADAEWARARAAVRRTGRPDLLARVELARCAAELASLVAPAPGACPAFDALAPDAAPAEQAYARYLIGQASAADVPLLPAAQQAIARAAAASPDAATAHTEAATRLRAIPEPMSRLVAAAAWLQRTQAEPPARPPAPLEIASIAVETASAQGWQRPLLAWLALQEGWARQAGNTALAEQARRRMALVGGEAAR
jgi:hypothetical protein